MLLLCAQRRLRSPFAVALTSLVDVKSDIHPTDRGLAPGAAARRSGFSRDALALRSGADYVRHSRLRRSLWWMWRATSTLRIEVWRRCL